MERTWCCPVPQMPAGGQLFRLRNCGRVVHPPTPAARQQRGLRQAKVSSPAPSTTYRRTPRASDCASWSFGKAAALPNLKRAQAARQPRVLCSPPGRHVPASSTRRSATGRPARGVSPTTSGRRGSGPAPRGAGAERHGGSWWLRCQQCPPWVPAFCKTNRAYLRRRPFYDKFASANKPAQSDWPPSSSVNASGGG